MTGRSGSTGRKAKRRMGEGWRTEMMVEKSRHRTSMKPLVKGCGNSRRDSHCRRIRK